LAVCTIATSGALRKVRRVPYTPLIMSSRPPNAILADASSAFDEPPSKSDNIPITITRANVTSSRAVPMDPHISPPGPDGSSFRE
jgi:hypothetical protein